MLGKQKKSIEIAFGITLRKIRKSRDMTQEILAFEADLQRNYISLLELGTNQPTIATIFKLSKALKIEPNQLIKLVEIETKN